MAHKEYISEVELAEAVFEIRFVSQKRRDEIAESCTRKVPGGIGELNVPKFYDAMADALIAGWSRVTPETAMRLGYEDFESLPVNDAGEVPFTAPTARKLYRYCLRDKFANEIDFASRAILEALAREKKSASAPSETSPAASA